MRKQVRAGCAFAALALVAGCSTPGPLHLYATTTGAEVVHDRALTGSDVERDVPSFLEPTDTLTGFAYDPFTDHFFLRLDPGNRIRVVDRPARKIKREFIAEHVPDGSHGDLAVSPRDGHLYFIQPGTPQIVETSRLGEYVRTITLEGETARPAAIAYDAVRKHLLVLDPAGTGIGRYDLEGRLVAQLRLELAAMPSIAFDPEQRELYAPLAGNPGEVGVFAENGHCVRRVPSATGDRFIDVGPHSFLRVF